jgi:hypothetical protein
MGAEPWLGSSTQRRVFYAVLVLETVFAAGYDFLHGTIFTGMSPGTWLALILFAAGMLAFGFGYFDPAARRWAQLLWSGLILVVLWSVLCLLMALPDEWETYPLPVIAHAIGIPLALILISLGALARSALSAAR